MGNKLDLIIERNETRRSRDCSSGTIFMIAIILLLFLIVIEMELIKNLIIPLIVLLIVFIFELYFGIGNGIKVLKLNKLIAENKTNGN